VPTRVARVLPVGMSATTNPAGGGMATAEGNKEGSGRRHERGNMLVIPCGVLWLVLVYTGLVSSRVECTVYRLTWVVYSML
jgi:hypothetical protein